MHLSQFMTRKDFNILFLRHAIMMRLAGSGLLQWTRLIYYVWKNSNNSVVRKLMEMTWVADKEFKWSWIFGWKIWKASDWRVNCSIWKHGSTELHAPRVIETGPESLIARIYSELFNCNAMCLGKDRWQFAAAGSNCRKIEKTPLGMRSRAYSAWNSKYLFVEVADWCKIDEVRHTPTRNEKLAVMFQLCALLYWRYTT